MKLKWRVDPAPTGRYSSFERRGWPSADFKGTDQSAAYIRAVDNQGGVYATQYKGEYGKCPDQELPFELIVMVAIPNPQGAESSWDWKALKARATSLTAAKALAQDFYDRHPHIVEELMRQSNIRNGE